MTQTETTKDKRVARNTSLALSMVDERGGEALFDSVGLVTEEINVKCINGHIFSTTLDRMKQGKWCRSCSSGLYERICRAYFEQIFAAEFPNTRQLDWLKTEDGVALELDGFNSELSLAFEHQGAQHYKKDAFYPHSKYDELKKRLCDENDIHLIEIPELVSRLPLKELPRFLFKSLLQAGFDVTIEAIKEINFTSAYRFSEFENLRKRGADSGFKLLSHNAVISAERYKWQCLRCLEEIERDIYQLESKGCQVCKGRDVIGEVDGKYLFSTITELAQHFFIDEQTAMRLARDGLSGQEIVNSLLGENRTKSNFPITKNSFFWNGEWYQNKNSALRALGVKPKALESFRLRRGLEFTEGLRQFIARQNKSRGWIVFGEQFFEKKKIYERFKVSEGRVRHFQKNHKGVPFEKAVERLAIIYEGAFFANLEELASAAEVKYQTLVQRMQRNGSHYNEEIKYLKEKSKK
jgi:hypothetical protein